MYTHKNNTCIYTYISMCTCIYTCEYIGEHSISSFLILFQKKRDTVATAGGVLCHEKYLFSC